MTDDRYDKVQIGSYSDGSPKYLTKQLAGFLWQMGSDLGYTPTSETELTHGVYVVQGCFHGGTSQSAGTHDGADVCDLTPDDHERKVHWARAHGGFYYHRLPIPDVWEEHIHGGLRGSTQMSYAAYAQQLDYDMSPPRDGLADHAYDYTWHPNPPCVWDYAKYLRENEMQASDFDKIQAMLDKATSPIANALTALRVGERDRFARTQAVLRGIDSSVTDIEDTLNALPKNSNTDALRKRVNDGFAVIRQQIRALGEDTAA